MLHAITQHKLKTVLLLALLARLLFLLALGPGIFFYEQTGLIHGSTAYDEYALNLLETGIYGREAGVPDANIAPLYSYAVAAIYALFGRGGLQIGIFHTLLDLLTIALVYDSCRRLFREGTFFGQPAGEWIGAGAALFTALYPYLIFQNLTLIDTALFMTLMHLFIWLLIRLREADNWRSALVWGVLAGLVLGVTTLVRALLPLFAIFAALWFLFRRPFWTSVLRLLPVALISIVVLLPWLWRNTNVYDAFVPVALNTGDNLWQGSNPMTVPLFRAGYDAQWSDPPAGSVPDSNYRNNQVLQAAAVAYLRENPATIPELLWVKFGVHWNPQITPRNNPLPGQSFALAADGTLLVRDDPDADKQDIATLSQYESGLFDRVARPLHTVYFGSLLLLAIGGVIVTRQQWRAVSLIWFLQISMTIMYLIFHPSTRYRVPTDPLLFAFSAAMLLWLAQQLAARYRGRALSHI